MLKAPRGTYDIYPPDSRRWQRVQELVRSLFAAYGYGEICTPLFEETALFSRSIGEETDIVSKEMYTFVDRGGRSLSLRPEGTAPVVRAYLEHKMGASGGPTKLYYIGPFFRYERPQANRTRQFYQAGVELFGVGGPAGDAEVIELASRLLAVLGIEDGQVLLNSIGCPECRPAYVAALVGYASGYKGGLCETCLRRLSTNPLRILDCKVSGCRRVLGGAPSPVDYLCGNCRMHLDGLLSLLERLGVGVRLEPSLVRGFDYYTGTVFEAVSERLGARSAVIGGGRYDRLVEDFGGPPTPAVGFAAGLGALVQLASLDGEGGGPEVYVVHLSTEALPDALAVASGLRRAGVVTEVGLEPRSVKAQMRAADRLGARVAVFVGGEEAKRGAVKVRELAGGAEWEVQTALLEGSAEGIRGALGLSGPR